MTSLAHLVKSGTRNIEDDPIPSFSRPREHDRRGHENEVYVNYSQSERDTDIENLLLMVQIIGVLSVVQTLALVVLMLRSWRT